VLLNRALGPISSTHDSTVASRAQRIGLMRNGQLEIRQDTTHGAS
jgi:predicted ABC-type transport system involved in lysophospholipase L1 biosynthesis ATPase subunit